MIRLFEISRREDQHAMGRHPLAWSHVLVRADLLHVCCVPVLCPGGSSWELSYSPFRQRGEAGLGLGAHLSDSLKVLKVYWTPWVEVGRRGSPRLHVRWDHRRCSRSFVSLDFTSALAEAGVTVSAVSARHCFRCSLIPWNQVRVFN